MATTVPNQNPPTALAPRDNRFPRFWAGQSVSQFGDRITELALPLLAVTTLDATPAQVATLTALIWAPNLLAILLGSWVDQQRRKRRLMVLADLIRAAALLTLPIGYALGTVPLAQLYAVALVTGAAGVLFNCAYPSFFARLVEPADYVRANSRLSTSRSASYVAGPALGGALIQALTAPVAVVADALSFLVSAVLIGRIPLDEPQPATGGDDASFVGRARDGLAFTLRHPVLRAALGCATTVNFFTFIAQGLLVLFAGRTLGLSAGAIGLALGLGSTGALLGALLAPRISRALGMGRTIVLGAVLFPAPLALAAVAGGPAWARAATLCAAEFLMGAGVMLFDIPLNSLQTSVIPDEVRSRVSGAFATVNYGIRPLGALTGGLLADLVGLRPTLVLAAFGGVLAALWLLPSPIPRVRSLDPVAEADADAKAAPERDRVADPAPAAR
ncbi:MFS transporter [Kitasatospora camelliae]|uniref:MFS transporter n=1 Tax=Kitasatospora camelliae TaxID=3156397 RepID=A0AAU8K6D6_9ACTN